MSDSLATAPRFSFETTFAALKYPNYRLWFFGQMVSLFGTWMQATAQAYLVFELTHSADYLGYVAFAGGVPAWLLMLYGGVVADRFDRRWVLFWAQAAMMVLAIILAVLTFTNVVQPWHILILAFLLGTANAFEAPARLAFVPELVDRPDMTNAIALNATMFNVGTALGPAIAGITYAAFGPAWCFAINALSFVAVIVALWLMQLQPKEATPKKDGSSSTKELIEALRYIVKNRLLAVQISILAVVSIFGVSFVTLIPAWAVDVLGGDSTTNGFLLSARGVGGLVAALLVASLGRFKFKGKLLTLGTFVFPTFLLAFTFMRWLPLSIITLFIAGGALIIIFNLNNSMVQNLLPDELRGRVMSVYSLAFFGLQPFGGLMVGVLAERITEPPTVALGALVCLAFAVWLWFFVPQLRRSE